MLKLRLGLRGQAHIDEETSVTKESLTFLFLPESAYGPTNNCIGVGKELVRRGHRVVFASESSWTGQLSPHGFVEDLVDLEPPAEDEAEQDAGAFWKNYIQEISPEFLKSTEEQLTTVSRPILEALIEGVKYSAPALREVVERNQPDVTILDNVLTFPALMTSPAKYVRVVSCNPLEVPGENIAPVFSGLGQDDREGWATFREAYERSHREVWEDFNAWVQEQGAPPLPYLEFSHAGDRNLYLYPAEIDYTDARPLDSTWYRIDSAVRETETEADIPAHFLDGSKPLIYFSLGSLGGADVGLMRSVIAALAETDYHIIVSKGPLHAEIELADNMWGAEFLPQTMIIPKVDLVITHGGNNTVTESLHFGKPMVLMPLFWDQYDNAQRVHEKGLGRRVDTYRVSATELRQAVADLLADTEMRAEAERIGERIRARRGLHTAADLLVEIGRQGVAERAGS